MKFPSILSGLLEVLRRPALAVSVIVPLALATAASTALFAVSDGLLWRKLPFPQVERVVVVELPSERNRRARLGELLRSDSAAEEFQRSLVTSGIFVTFVKQSEGGYFNSEFLRHAGIEVASVGLDFFDAFGLPPAHGRLFNIEDERTALAGSGPLPVILSHHFWTRQFGAKATVVGQNATVGDRAVAVVGVMAPGVKFPGRTDIWTPIGKGKFYAVAGFGLLAPDVSLQQAQDAFPELDLQLLRDKIRPKDSGALVFMFCTTLALLLLAWVQVSGLVLADASDRRHELAVRLALGATHGRVARERAVQGAWMAIAAFIVAAVATPLLTSTLVGLLPESMTKAQYLDLNWRAFVFAGATTSAGVAVLAWMSLQIAHARSPALLVSRAGTEIQSTGFAHRSILTVQVACTVVTLYFAGLSALSYVNMVRFDFGFAASRVLIVEPPLGPGPGASSMEVTRAFLSQEAKVEAMAIRLSAVPGIEVATPISDSPIAGRFSDIRNDVVRFQGRPIPPIPARIIGVGDDIVQALGATLVSGYDFSNAPYRGQSRIALVNETLANLLSPSVPPLGMRIATQFLDATIVGVVRDLVDATPDTPSAPLILQPSRAPGVSSHMMVVRTTGNVEALYPSLKKMLEGEFGPLGAMGMRALEKDVTTVVKPWRSRALVLGLVALLGLPLGLLGLGSGMQFFARVRRRDIAIRMALGATPQQARALVVTYALRIAVVGTSLGIAVGFVLSQMMTSWLFGVQSAQAVSVGVVGLAMVATAWLAAYLPARYASEVNPAVVLRGG